MAAACNVALEINNSSFIHSRPGSEPQCLAIAEAVGNAGGLVALGSDSHTSFTLGNFDESLRILRQVGFPEQQILNTSPRKLLDFLEMRGGKPIEELAGLV